MQRREFLEWCISITIGCTPGSKKSRKRRSRNKCIKYYPSYRKAKMALPLKGWVEYGGNQTPAYFAEPLNSEEIWGTPVDGSVIQVVANNGDEVSIKSVSTNIYTIADLSDSIEYLKERNALGWGRVRYNFAKAQISSPTGLVIDWFNPDLQFENVWSLIGEESAEAEQFGVALDGEPYVNMWLYSTMPENASHSYADYVAKVKSVARAIGTRWLAANPNIQVLCFFGYRPYVDNGGPDETNPWGLYKPFLDELITTFGEFVTGTQEGCRCTNCSSNFIALSQARIIITDENTYGCRTNACLVEGIDKITGAAGAAYKGGSPYFDLVCDFGAALWLTKPTFNPLTPSTNYFTPEKFAEMMKRLAWNGMMWPWIYDPDYSFFNEATPVPQDYITQLFLVRVALGLI